jgi:phage tail tape-measure protein
MPASKNQPVKPMDENRDPISGEPGAHPLGTGIGAVAAGAAAGAAGGAVGGPVGLVAGTVIGAVAGGLGGKAIAESFDPTVEDAYWRENYRDRPYAESSLDYDHYRPAYQYGWEARSLYSDKSWEEIESALEESWARRRGSSSLDWKQARQASRDAWDRVSVPDGSSISDNV